jgi:hypothetical protein
MRRVTLEINSSIYDYIMFFLENIPKNLLKIKQETLTKTQNSGKEINLPLDKKLPKGFLNPIKIDSYKTIAKRDELHER